MPPTGTAMAGSRATPAGGADAGTAFAIEHPLELAAWLRLLGGRAVPVHLVGADGAGVAATIRAVDTERGRFTLDAGAGGPVLAALAAGEECTAIACVDDVKLQFDLHNPLLVHGDTWCALEAPLPRRLYRFQRRKAFRVQAPAYCGAVVRFRHPALAEMQLSLRVLDLSVGGCALQAGDDVPAIEAGIEIGGARLCLDVLTELDVRLQVLHVTSIGPGSGSRRLGCALGALSGEAEHALQRWIDRVQRRARRFGR